MAGSIPVGSLVTDVKLNGSQPVTTLKELKQAVSGATSAWRAQEAVLKSAGKQTEAAKAKYAGLTETVKNQRKYIEALADKQRNLKKVQAEADQTTEKGKQAYKNATEEIRKNAAQTLRATTRLESLTKQQEKAKSSLNYYSSGLAEAQKSLKQTQDVARSYIERLQAEGRQYEANKTRLATYRTSIENLTKQQKMQADELVRIGKASGEASEAYKRQQIRLNQTSTTLAKTKNEMNELSSSMQKANPSVFDRIKNKLGSVNKEAGQTHKTFKEVFAGSVVGNAVSNAVSNLTGKLKGAVSEGMALNAATAKINARFKSMGMSTKGIETLDKQIGDLKAQTNMTGDNVANLQTKMLNWSNIGTKGAMQMTKMIASVGDSSKLSGDQIEQMGASLMRVGSTGKVTYSALNRVTKSAPTFMAQLAKGAGMSESKLKSVLKTGKVTQTQFQKWMASAAKYSDTAFKGFSSTQGGALKFMQVRWQKLEQTMTKPLFDAKTSGLQSLKDIMSSPELLKGATAIGNALSSTLGYIDKHKKDIAGITSDITHIAVQLGKDVWKDISGIIGDIGKSFGLIHGNTKKTEDPLHMVKLTMDGLAKNKTAIQWISKAIVAMAAVKGLKAITSPLTSLATLRIGSNSLIGWLAKGGLSFSKGMLHPIKSITDTWDKFLIHLSNGKTRVGKITDAFKTGFSKIGKFGQASWRVISKGWSKATDLGSKAGKGIVTGLKKGVNGIGQAGKWLGSKLLSGSKALISKATELGRKIGGAISKAVKATAKFGMGKRLATGAVAGAAVAAPEVINAVKDRHSADKRSQDIGGAVGAVAGGTLTSMIPVVGPMLAPVGAIIGKYAGRWGGQAVNNFTKGWQRQGRNKKPQNWVQWLGFQAHNSFDFFAGLGKKAVTAVGKGFNSAKSFAKKNSKELALTAVSPLLGIPALLYKNNPKFRKWANSVGRNVKKGLKTAGKAVNSFKNSLGRNFKKAWDSAYKHSSKGTRQIMRSVSKFAKNYVKTNSKANRATLKNFSSFGARLKKNHGNLFKTLGQTARTQLAIEKRRWSSNWKNIRSAAAGIWKGINRNASDMYHKLNSATHGGLSKVFDGFKSFGKSIAGFWTDLWKNVTKTFSDTIKGLKDAANNVGKFFTGKLKVGSLHLANGTDWRSRYGVPAIVNDAPGNNYREGLITNGKVVPFPAKRNLPIWLMPDQDIINGNDMSKMFGHFANGTVDVKNFSDNDLKKLVVTTNKLANDQIKLYKDEIKKRDKRYRDHKDHRDKLDRKRDHKTNLTKEERAKAAARAKKDQEQLKKLGDRISSALKHKKGTEARRLTAEFNKLTKKYSADKKASKKPNPHAGKVLVDQGLLIGAKSRIGHSVYIDKKLFKRLIANLNKKTKKKSTRKKTTTRRRKTTSTRRRSYRVFEPRITARSSAGASVVGVSSLKGLKSKAVKVSVKTSGNKALASLAKSISKIKGGKHKVTVKSSGTKSLNKLYKATKKIKGKTHKVKVKSSGTKGLKSLQRNVTSVHKRIDSLAKAAKKDKFGASIAKQAEEAVKSLKGKGNFAKQFNSMVKKFEKDLKAMVKTAQKEFKSMWSNMEHSSKTSQSSMLHSLSSFSKKFKHDWSSLQSGVYKSFSHFWTNMKNAAGKGVNSVIKVLNSAIGKIDNVISDFGGSKTAVSKSSLVHYASGTDENGRLMQDTLAIVNDAKSGPRQEAIVTDKNDVILPKGNNVPVMLRKGWGVLNGAQTQSLGLSHFANGTGLKGLYELAKKYWNHPVKTGQSMFGAINGLIGAINDLASGMRGKTEKSGVNWWSQLWKMVEDKVNDDLGPASGLLKAVEKLGRGKHYLWGGYGLDSKGLDCSGLVSTALEHYYHSGWGHLDVGGLWQHAHRISRSEAKPGDPVFWLPDEHAGVYAGHGMYYSAYGPNNGGPIGMQPVGSGATFGRFKGINTEGSKNAKEAVKVKANNRLQKQIKNQVGQGFWKTIQKIADKYGEQFNGANSISGSMIEAAARKMHVHLPDGFVKDVLRVAMSESGNRNIQQQIHDVNSGGNEAQGPLQFTPQTFKAFAMPGHTNIHNPYDELLAFFNNSDWRNSIGWTTIWGHRKFDWLHSGPIGHRRYANGGITSVPSIFGEAGPEMAIPLIPSKSTRAWELIGKAVGILSSQTNLQVQNVNNEKERKEEHDFRQAVLLLLTEIAGKSDVAKITLTTPAGRALWSVIQPFAKQENKREITRLRRGLSGR